MNEWLENYNVLLGSGSPRRRELLSMMDINFDIVKIEDVDEVYPEEMKPEDVPLYLSQIKSQAYSHQLKKNDLLITADTVVIFKDRILGKPSGAEDAVNMLETLSGNSHKVVTGVTLLLNGKTHSFSEMTEVEFNNLTKNEIVSYVNKYSPLDKAGAYGIQEWIGAVGVKRINGCFYNVMGLPISLLFTELRQFLKN